MRIARHTASSSAGLDAGVRPTLGRSQALNMIAVNTEKPDCKRHFG